MAAQLSPRLPPEILSYYGEGCEECRLLAVTSRLAFTLTHLTLAL